MREDVNAARSRYEVAAGAVVAGRAKLSKARREYKTAVKAQQVLQHVASELQRAAHAHLCSIVSKCLKAVYLDEAYDFQIVFDKKRGKTEARLEFVRGGEVFEPNLETGMGQREVANLALTVAEIVMTGKRRLLVADEPFTGVHGEGNRERLAALLPVLCEDLGFQFVFATGNEWLMAAGEVVHITK